MPIMGMTYSKILAKKKDVSSANVQIKTAPEILDVAESKLTGMGPDTEVLIVSFRLASKFKPDIGSLEIEGKIIYNADNIAKILAAWKKDKALPAENHVEIINHIFRKVCVEALHISDVMQLPPVINLPKLEAAKKK